MKLLSGAVLLLAAEQAYAHSQLIGFPNHEAAGDVLIPAAVVFLTLGCLFVVWGVLSEGRAPKPGVPASVDD